MEWYHLFWWPWLTSKRVARFVSYNWVSCSFLYILILRVFAVLQWFVWCKNWIFHIIGLGLCIAAWCLTSWVKFSPLQDSISVFPNRENKIQFRQLSSLLCCTFIDNTATKSDIEHTKSNIEHMKSDIEHVKAVQQTVLDNQQVILQSLHENQTNIDRLGKLYFSNCYSQKLHYCTWLHCEQPLLELVAFMYYVLTIYVHYL